MAGVPHGQCFWQTASGILSPQGATYTCSQGISPGTIMCTFNPQGPAPSLIGNFVFTDGLVTITIPNCRVVQFHLSEGGGGPVWQTQIEDRRWQWRETCVIHGMYNQPDPTGQLTKPPPDSGPIAVNPVKLQYERTPTQLAALCLDAMGETGYVITGFDDSARPAVHWDWTNPAQALSSLVNGQGCRVIYRLDTDTVLIAAAGVGAILPPGSISHEAPTVKVPARPDSLLLIGAPIRYQARFVLEAVGQEWDKSLQPIELLSYVPPQKNVVAQWLLTPKSVAVSDKDTLTFNYFVGLNLVTVTVTYTSTPGTVADMCSGLKTAINASAWAVQNGVHATSTATTVTVFGPTDGSTPLLSTAVTGTGTLAWQLKVQGQQSTSRWSFSPPPGFMMAQATTRLTKEQARAHARASVFRYYRIVNLDATSREGPVNVPGATGDFQTLLRIQQVLLAQTTLDPTYPDPGLVNAKDPKTGEPIQRWFYDSMSRERPARVYGAYKFAGSLIYTNPSGSKVNTLPTDEVLAPFRIDPASQCVVFSQPVYYQDNLGVHAAELVLETSFTLRHPVTNAVQRCTFPLALPGPKLGTGPTLVHHPDVELLVAARYNFTTGPSVLQALSAQVDIDHNLPEAVARAAFYLNAEAAKYEVKNSGTRSYNGLVPIWLDGAVGQVTWAVGSGGAVTTASRNSEHASYIPTLQQRLRIEYLTGVNEQKKLPDSKPPLDRPPGA